MAYPYRGLDTLENARHGTEGKEEDAGGAKRGKTAGSKKPQIHVHSHERGHTVHVMHPDGRHEMHEHEPGDSDGVAERVRDAMSGSEGEGMEGMEE